VVETEIVGRDEELAQIGAFLAQAGARALLLEGEAGIGKTTLWRAGVDLGRARGCRVLACSPSGAEATLSFAALRDLLDTAFDDAADELPEPQRHALAVALLREDAPGSPPPQGAIAAAVVGLLHRLARETPLLVALDDVQWLDAPSARLVEFAARRFGESPIALFVARRGNGQGVPLALDRAFEKRLSIVPVGPLSLGALHRMLRDRLEVGLSRPLLRRIHDASGGNPYFALEIGRLITEEHNLDPSGPLPLPEGLAELLGIRLAMLSPQARHVALAAAALHDPTVVLLERALDGDLPAMLEELASAHVLEFDGDRIRFTHPLLAATAYGSAQADGLRVLHRCLAEAVGSVEEQARHLALGADRPDPEIAGVLDEAARRARARGASATAAELAEEAVRLTPADQPREALRRTIDSAGHHFEAGDPGRARRLLDDAVEAAAPGPERADALWRLARVHVFEADHKIALGIYSQALAEAGERVEVTLEAEAGIAVAMMRMLEDLPAAARHARAAVELAEALGVTQMLPEYLGRQALIEGLLGHTQAVAIARRAAELDERASVLGTFPGGYFGRGLSAAGFILGVLLQWADDLAGARELIEAAMESSVDIGDESSVPLLLRYRATTAWLSGDWAQALRDADEGYEVALQTGQPSQQAVLAGARSLVLAHLGREDETRETAEDALGLSAETGAMFGTMLATSALGFLELSLGNAAEADRHLGPLVERMETAGIREPGAVRFVPDEVEALIALGRVDEAEALLSRVERRARRLDRPSALAAAGRCRGLLETARGRREDGLAAYRSALTEHDRAPMPFERARTLLVLGGLERRAKQKRVARDSLLQALETFESLGSRLWAGRARAELASIGGRAPSEGGLTPTEQRVAELVAEGRATKEVASMLFVSPKTVEGHLSRIYAKLGVRSRTELATRFRPGPTGS